MRTSRSLYLSLGFSCLLWLPPLLAQQVFQSGFEGKDILFQQSKSDVDPKVSQHTLTGETAHAGQKSEWIQFTGGNGNYFHFHHDLGRAPVTDELNISLWVKANRPGIQLFCRVVLPKEREPKNLDQPLTLVLKGDTYQLTGRWQQLTLRQPVRRLKEQVNLFRAETGKDAVVADAYVDRLIMNVYAGPGQTDVWLDDMEIGPILEHKLTTPAKTPEEVPGKTLARRTSEVQLKGNQLLVSGQKFFLRGIRHSGTPLKTLRDAGFNTLWVNDSISDQALDEAVNQGFWIVPVLQGPSEGEVPAQLTSQQVMGKKMARFLEQEAVLCWDLGSNLSFEKNQAVTRTAQSLRNADPLRPLAADIWDGFQRYSRGIDQVMVGAHRWPLFTTMELPMYRDWLLQKKRLSQPGTYTWTWIQTHIPDWQLQLLYPQDGKPGQPIVAGPHPEHLRLLTFTALGAGCRGVGFWSDRFLADSHQGRDRLLALALLNQELQLLEPLIVNAEDPFWIDTSLPDVKAAVLRSEKGILVLPIWMGKGTQFVPPQGGATELTFVVPQAPTGAQVWEITAGQVRSIPWSRVVGGTQISLKEFSLATAVVLTSDLSPTGLVVGWQDAQRKKSKLAAQWAHDLAEEEFNKVLAIQTKLENNGRHLADSEGLMKKSREFIAQSLDYRRNGEYGNGFAAAQRALRPLRILMRAAWEQALRDLDNPVATPFSPSYFTLPEHYQMWGEIQAAKLQANVLPDGDFETPAGKEAQGWVVQEVPSLDEVAVTATRVSESPRSGKQCLKIQAVPKNPLLAPVALERTFLGVYSPSIKLNPGSLVRISGWVRIPQEIKGSPDGALFFDSVGGEPLGIRLTAPTEWRHYSFYRKVPTSGTVGITLALTGMGAVYFDDWKVEPLEGSPQPGVEAAPNLSGINPLPNGSQSKP